MKVLHVIDSGGFYGAEVMLLNLCLAQLNLGLDAEVVSIGTPRDYEKALERKLIANNIPCKKWRMLALPDLRESRKLLSYAKDCGATVIHSHGYKGNILFGMMPRRWRPIPIIATMHGYTGQKGFSKMKLNQLLDKFCLNRLDAIVLVSEGMRHQLPSSLDTDKIYTVANGIPEFVSSAVEEPIDFFEKTHCKIGAIGRLSHEKNFQLLIRAIPLVLRELPHAKLVIYGEGPERAALESLVLDLSVEHAVFLPGYIEEPARLFRQADVFVNCSLTEGMPMTLLEAMRDGCQIVASDIPANRSLLGELATAATLVPLSIERIAEAIINVAAMAIADVACAKKEAINLFKSRYTAAEMARTYKSVYLKVSNSNV